ncbi:hypothetical protein L1887_53373 [Cichorium endivia]|nr:hypothetical protein L1887_53373 [Cichorium endivia]
MARADSGLQSNSFQSCHALWPFIGVTASSRKKKPPGACACRMPPGCAKGKPNLSVRSLGCDQREEAFLAQQSRGRAQQPRSAATAAPHRLHFSEQRFATIRAHHQPGLATDITPTKSSLRTPKLPPNGPPRYLRTTAPSLRANLARSATCRDIRGPGCTRLLFHNPRSYQHAKPPLRSSAPRPSPLAPPLSFP